MIDSSVCRDGQESDPKCKTAWRQLQPQVKSQDSRGSSLDGPMTKCYLIASSLLQVSSMGLSATPLGGPCLSGNVSLTQMVSYYSTVPHTGRMFSGLVHRVRAEFATQLISPSFTDRETKA